MLAGYLREGVGFRILSNPSMGMPEKGAKMLLVSYSQIVAEQLTSKKKRGSGKLKKAVVDLNESLDKKADRIEYR